MTPAERTTARIRQNREIDEKVAVTEGQRIPAASTKDYVRGTPNEHAKVGGVIRKVRILARSLNLDSFHAFP